MTVAGPAHPSRPPESGEPHLHLLEGGREAARGLERVAAHVSRSYAGSYALVAMHSRPVGVDIECLGPVEPDFGVSIATPQERAWADRADPEALISLWSSKEALAKALGDASRHDPRRLGSPLFWPGGRAGRWRARMLEPAEGYVGWVCWSD